MGRVIKERLKTICIFLLIITGVLQVGILWGYQNQGAPTSFLLGFLSKSPQKISNEDARERLFVPDRLILSDGNSAHWIINRENAYFDDPWNEAKKGLESIVTGKAGLKPSDEAWGDIAEKRGYIIDFGYEMKPELLEWFLGVELKAQDMPAILKIMIKPDIVDESVSTFYLYSADGKVHMSDPISYSRDAGMYDVINAYLNGAKEHRKYISFKGGKIDETMGAESDVLYVNESPKYWPYYEYSVEPPVRAEKRDELSDILLGTEKGRYSISNDDEGTLQFNYGNKIYRYYEDGYLTYQYLEKGDPSIKQDIGDALFFAYKFIAEINQITDTDASIILASVQELQQGIFSFGFDYRLNGMPVKADVEMKDGSGQKLQHAIVIQADSKRVLKCDWLLRDFKQGKKSNYNDRFADLELLKYTGLAFDQLHIQHMRPGYFMGSGGDSILKPVLLLDMKDKTSFQVEMPSEKGD